MKNRRWISLLLVGAMLISGCTVFVGCNRETPDTPDTSVTDPVSDTDTSVPEPPAIPLPKLSALTLDDGTVLPFDPENTTYEVTLPAGRPRIPRIAAAAADADAKITVYQPMFPDTATEAIARVDVELGELSNSYTVVFKKDASLGFHLQYDDRYTFTPAYTLGEGETFTFESSNADVITVSADGILQVKDSVTVGNLRIKTF